MSSDERLPFSRRAIVGASGLGLVAAARRQLSRRLRRASPSASPNAAPAGLQDPRKQVPKAAVPPPVAALAGAREPNGPAAGPRRDVLSRLGPAAGRKALITGGDSGMGRAAAIAFAREGADVAINYLPDEEPDAREVIELIKGEGRIGLVDSGRYSRRGVLQAPGRRGGQRSRRPRHPRQQCGAPTEPRLDPRYLDRGLRRDDEDQHLRAVLDHQGGAAASAAGLGASSAPPPNRLTIPRPTSTTMRRPRLRP